MSWFNRPQPQEDDHESTSMPLEPVDPDHKPEDDGDKPFDPFTQWERDEDGWPIVPGPGTMPPVWKA